MANLVTPQKTESDPIVAFRTDLNAMKGQINILLPREITPEVFIRVAVTAIQRNPELLVASRKSLLDACLECCKEGLLPDGKEAAFVIFNTKIEEKGKADRWEKTVAYMPMVKGEIKRLYRYADVLKITAHCVYENDLFDYELGDNEFIKHKPALSNRGKQVGAYAIFKLKNGETVRGFMDIAGIEKRRLSSKSAEGNYWKKWYDEMSRKTVIKWAAKEIDKSIDYNDDEDTDNIIPPQISYKPEESNKPQLVEPEQVQEAEVVDRDTGEITTLTEKTPKKVSVQTNSSDEPF